MSGFYFLKASAAKFSIAFGVSSSDQQEADVARFYPSFRPLVCLTFKGVPSVVLVYSNSRLKLNR